MKVGGKHYKTVWFRAGVVHLIDQNALPFRFKILRCKNHVQTADAIQRMFVRGAGAIGVAAGFAMAQATQRADLKQLQTAKKLIESTRPTARNLFYAVERVYTAAVRHGRSAAIAEAQCIAAEDEAAARRIGELGEKLISHGSNLMTHCNAGWLAFSDWGTALAPLYAAKRKGKKFFVYVDETRPRSQGARLTAWELGNERIPHAVIADSAAGHIMQNNKIRFAIVGADRIAANGDVANKIGTYSLAVLAKENKIPFYVAAPLATFDLSARSGASIPIESRPKEELFDRQWFRTMKRSGVQNPAFDVTPAKYITGIITEKGIIRANRSSIASLH